MENLLRTAFPGHYGISRNSVGGVFADLIGCAGNTRLCGYLCKESMPSVIQD